MSLATTADWMRPGPLRDRVPTRGARRSIERVLVHAGDSVASDARVRCAVAVANLFGARVHGVSTPPDRPVAPFAGPDGYDEKRMSLEWKGERFRDLTGPVHAGASWCSSMRPPLEALTRAAFSADLLVADRGESRAARRRRDTLIRSLGRPVLLMPRAPRPLEARNVVVCWNDSAGSRRALNDALPFLRQAKHVVVLTVTQTSGLTTEFLRTDEVAAGLVKLGVNAGGLSVGFSERSLATVVERIAEEFSADLVVAGAYGRSPLRRALFGGKTDRLIAGVDRYLLLSR